MSFSVRKSNMIFILTIKHLINLKFCVTLQCFYMLMAAVPVFSSPSKHFFFLEGGVGVVVVSMWRMAAALAAFESAG